MSQLEVERFLGRLITDADFRAKATCSLKTVCYGEGFALSLEEMLLLGRIDYVQFAPIAESLDDSIRRN